MEQTMTQPETMSQYNRLDLRTRNCGSFEKALIAAWFAADTGNKARLQEAFKDTQFDLT